MVLPNDCFIGPSAAPPTRARPNGQHARKATRHNVNERTRMRELPCAGTSQPAGHGYGARSHFTRHRPCGATADVKTATSRPIQTAPRPHRCEDAESHRQHDVETVRLSALQLAPEVGAPVRMGSPTAAGRAGRDRGLRSGDPAAASRPERSAGRPHCCNTACRLAPGRR